MIVWTQWGFMQCTIRGILLTNRWVVWCAFKAAHRLSHWKSTSKLSSKSMFCGGGGSSWYRAGGLRYQRGWWIYWNSLSSRLGFSTNLDDYPEDFSQGEKIELDKNKVIYIRDEPITHIVYETFDIQKQKGYWSLLGGFYCKNW